MAEGMAEDGTAVVEKLVADGLLEDLAAMAGPEYSSDRL